MVDKWIRPEDYQQRIIENWKQLVWKDDIVFHLGDVIFSYPWTLKGILSDLPWYKILVQGNHDKNKLNWYLWAGFDEAYREYIIPGMEPILLTHRPVPDEWYAYKVCWHLHQYLGNNTFRHWECRYLDYSSRIFAMEYENYRPILLQDIVSENHISHQYIKSRWLLSIHLWYYKARVKWFIKRILSYLLK